jgi:hypothetical protein
MTKSCDVLENSFGITIIIALTDGTIIKSSNSNQF